MNRQAPSAALRASWLAVAFATVSLFTNPAESKTHRSTAAKNAFKRTMPCPANGHTSGPCPNWVIDHIEPLCAGGPDTPANMQWQTRPDSLIKDRAERAECRKN